jgi:hypothetical protein
MESKMREIARLQREIQEERGRNCDPLDKRSLAAWESRIVACALSTERRDAVATDRGQFLQSTMVDGTLDREFGLVEKVKLGLRLKKELDVIEQRAATIRAEIAAIDTEVDEGLRECIGDSTRTAYTRSKISQKKNAMTMLPAPASVPEILANPGEERVRLSDVPEEIRKEVHEHLVLTDGRDPLECDELYKPSQFHLSARRLGWIEDEGITFDAYLSRVPTHTPQGDHIADGDRRHDALAKMEARRRQCSRRGGY